MANTAHEFTLSEALETAKQHQHGGLDPAVTTFLEQQFDEIMQRVLAQPLTYMLARKEFAVFAHFRGLSSKNAVAQRAIRRFRVQQYEEKLRRSRERDANRIAHAYKPTHACERCRQRKIRCNGERPSCQVCNLTNSPCVYADGKRDLTRK